MSIWAKTWAYAQHPKRVDENGNVTSKKHPAAKSVLVALAEYPGPGERHCWPSQRTLAEMTDMTERQVRRCMADLETQNIIHRKEERRSNGARTTDTITLVGPIEEFGPTKRGTDALGDPRTREPHPPDDLSAPPGRESRGAPDDLSGLEPSVGTAIRETSSLTNVREEASADKSSSGSEGKAREKAGEEKPVAERSVSQRQNYYIAYLSERLTERELIPKKPLTEAYKKRLSGELRNHINAGMRHAAILLVLDKIVHRWPEKRLDFYAAADDSDELTRRRESKERTTADREYDEVFKASYTGYASDFTDPENPGLPLMHPGFAVIDTVTGEPTDDFENEAHLAMGDLEGVETLGVGERCFWQGRVFRRDENGRLWSGRSQVAV